MNNTPIHILLVDYDVERRKKISDHLQQRFLQRKTVIHQAVSRSEALGHLWEMASTGVIPRAILTSWLLDEPGAREFYSLIGREVDHTSLSFLRNALKIDRATDDSRTILLCYTENEEQCCEALLEIQSETEMRDRVAVTCYDPQDEQSIESLADMLYRDERTRIYHLSAIEERLLAEAQLVDAPLEGPGYDSTTSGIRRALKRLSR